MSNNIDKIREKILTKNLILNTRYLKDDLGIADRVAKLVLQYDDRHFINKSEFIDNHLNYVLKYWYLTDHPEFITPISNLVINKTIKLKESNNLNKRQYHCICGRLRDDETENSYILPDRLPGVHYLVEPDCAKLIEKLVSEVINEL